MSVRKTRIGDVLELSRSPIDIVPNRSYRKLGICSWGRGMIHHPATPAAQMGSLRYFTLPPDALVLSNIQAWEAAVAISTQDDAENYVCSNRFLPYVPITPRTVDVRYLWHYFLSNRLKEKDFLQLTVPLPDDRHQAFLEDALNALDRSAELSRQKRRLHEALLPAARNEIFAR